MNNNFKLYSNYYDLINSEKDYVKEVDYINKLLNYYSETQVNSILDIGCGTGIHAEQLSKNGRSVLGIDSSNTMLEIAKERNRNINNLEFDFGDARNYRCGREFDAVTSLFHVMNYQTSDEDIYDSLETVSLHLKDNGLFIFDFWYGPAVIHQKPSARVKKLENNQIRIKRQAKPNHKEIKKIVEVNFTINVEDKLTNEVTTFNELHEMRYFDIPELKTFLDRFNFDILKSEEWVTSNEPSKDSWGVCIVARKCPKKKN